MISASSVDRNATLANMAVVGRERAQIGKDASPTRCHQSLLFYHVSGLTTLHSRCLRAQLAFPL